MRNPMIVRTLMLIALSLGALGVAACQSPEADDAPAAGAPGASDEGDEGDESMESDDDVAEAGDPEKGKKHFTTCAGCHGPEGKGLPNLGKDLTTSTFVADKTDAELVEFLKVGRAADAPDNTTHVAMPPKGGNPALSDDDLRDVVAFVRSLK